MLFAADSAVFRTGGYNAYLQVGSTAGTLMSTLDNERRREMSGPNQVVGVGDSRMALRARIANQSPEAGGYTYATIAVPGTSPRCWFYMLREVDPARDRYAAVVIPVPEYEDEDWADLAENTVDIAYLAPIIRLTDIPEFTASFRSPRARWEALRANVLKGWALRRDVQAFLQNPEKRLKDAAWVRRESAKSLYNYQWATKGVQGLAVDWTTRTITYPPDATAAQKQVFQNEFLRGWGTPTGKRHAYHRQWFGKIAAYYRGTRTKVVFLRLPRGPVVRPPSPYQRTSVIRELAARGDAIALDEGLFNFIEQPENFTDAVHMNGLGADLFSVRLAKEMRRILGEAKY